MLVVQSEDPYVSHAERLPYAGVSYNILMATLSDDHVGGTLGLVARGGRYDHLVSKFRPPNSGHDAHVSSVQIEDSHWFARPLTVGCVVSDLRCSGHFCH